MRLDLTARRNLELLETMRNKEKRGSLLGVLDHTHTAMGKRLMRSWIEQPLINPAQISRRHNAVDELVRETVLRGTLKMGTNENIKNPLEYRNAWYTFTPDHTGAYVFDPALRPVIYAMEGKKPVAQREIVNTSDCTVRYNLTEGITYYVGFNGGFVVGIDPDDQHLICTDIGTVNIHEYQSEDQIGDKMDEIDSTLEEILENIDEDTNEMRISYNTRCTSRDT